MDSERWKQVDEVLQAALDCAAGERDAFLRSACAGDDTLEREVRSLLTSDERAAGFLGDAALEVAARAMAREQVGEDTIADIQIGQKIAHYRILELLGRGGMGVVYKAEDTRLHRSVGLKFLVTGLARDAEVLSRFRREARAASALNHPNICTIYDVGGDDDRPFLVMEYLDGQSLKERIGEGRLEMNTVLTLGSEIAGALETAHGAGIIHRDVKPANIFVTRAGHAKVLDFGLVQLATANGSEDVITKPGTALGTAGYMSPEQAAGKPLDARTDLYSFGLVLYEMAAGSRQAHLVRLEQLPPGLARIISKCLEEDPGKRYAHASEISAGLERLERAETARPPVPGWKTAVLSATALLALAAAVYLYFHRVSKLTDKDTIVLADFTNKTGEPVFDGTLRQGLAIQLEQSPFLSMVSEQHIRLVLTLMSRPADAPLTPQIAKEICERTGSAAVLEGSIASLGSQYVLGLRARNCRTGDVLDEEQAQAARKEDVLGALTQMAQKFRTRVGESLATIEKHSTPLAEATTPSLEALRAYSTGVNVAYSGGALSAISNFKRAIEIDPNFAMAYSRLGLKYSNVGELALSAESAREAYRLRDRASDPERFFIMANYDRVVTGNLKKAQQTCDLWMQTYPREPEPHALLSGFISQGYGQYEKSIDEAQIAIGLDPDQTFAYVNLAYGYFYLDRPVEAAGVIPRASLRKLEVPEFALLRYHLAFLRNDEPAMEREVSLSRGKSVTEYWMAHTAALGLAHSGRLQQANQMSRRAIDLALQAGQRESAATYQTAAAVWEGFFGHAAAAKRLAAEALKLSKGRDVEYGAAVALALAGDFFRAQALANDLERRFAEDTSVQFSYLPTLRALAALGHNGARQAVEVLQAAASHELAVPGINFFAFFGSLYPAYVRGEAYLAEHEGPKAAAEFQKMIDHPGIMFADPAGALARFQLARALALSGEKLKAKAAYQVALALWKDADPDLPILIQAKAEYTALR